MRRSSTLRERLFLARRDDLGRRHRADPGKRVELGRRRLVQVDGRRCTAAVGSDAGGRWCRPGRRIVARRDADLVAVVQRRGEVQLPPGSVSVDSWAVAARRADQIADPSTRWQAVDARVLDRADDLHDERRSASGRVERAVTRSAGAIRLPSSRSPADSCRRPRRRLPCCSRMPGRTPRSPAAPRRRRRRPPIGERRAGPALAPSAAGAWSGAVFQMRATGSSLGPRRPPGGWSGGRRPGITRRLATLGALPTRRDVDADCSAGRFAATYPSCDHSGEGRATATTWGVPAASRGAILPR